MLRLLGCLMLVITGSMCGFVRAGGLKEHTDDLNAVCSMLREIIELIRYKRSTTEEIFDILKGSSSCSRFLERSRTSLNEDEHLLLEHIISGLGSTDAEGQISMLSYGLSRFSEYAGIASEKQKKDGRLYEVLGFMGGAFAAVMLI